MLQYLQTISWASHLVPALLILNVLLSAAGQILQILSKKEIPLLSKLSAVLKKVIDFISANPAH